MKKLTVLFMLLSLLLLTACSLQPAETIPPETTAHTTAPTTQPTTEPVETTPPTTLPEHSSLYIPDLSVEDVIVYFNEVCLDAEIVNSGDPSFLQKWDVPIYYLLDGTLTEEDRQVLESFAAWLNTIEGFPGIYETTDIGQANLKIYFCSEDEMLSILGSNFAGCDGGVTFWYMNNAIYDATICCRTDLYQYLRNSVIMEEIYNGLGPVQDTDLRPDSLIFSGFSEPQSLTPVDELILRLLYHPQMQVGINAAECEAVIRQLYY